MFQFLSWVNKQSPNIWKGNKLLSESQIGNVKAAIMNSTNEVHESVQRYDQDGNVIYTPLYADFDGSDCDKDVAIYIDLIEREFGITPDIYFSGRKGYHVFINVKVYHPYPHLIAKEFALLLSKKAKTLDLQVYASRHLLRSEGSVHLKSGLHKTRLFDKGSIGDEKLLRSVCSRLQITSPSVHESRLLNLFLPTILAKVDMEKRLEDEKYAQVVKENGGDVSPCIKALLMNQPVPGSNNTIITLMARNMNSIGMDKEDAIAFTLSHEHWSSFHREIRATFNSIWKRPSKFGCAKEPLLKENCDPFCHFNTNILAV